MLSTVLFAALVSLDDPLDQLVAHHVLMGELDDLDALHVPKDADGVDEAALLSRGRSIWVMSPVMMARLPSPRRVRNIFICSMEQFWASSRMM